MCVCACVCMYYAKIGNNLFTDWMQHKRLVCQKVRSKRICFSSAHGPELPPCLFPVDKSLPLLILPVLFQFQHIFVWYEQVRQRNRQNEHEAWKQVS